MPQPYICNKRVNDAVHWYMGDLGARVVAESGRACDRFHLGKLILRGLKDAPDFTLQINGLTGESESCASVLERSIKCANAFRALGLKRTDVIVMIAPNHLDLAIPYYAAMYLGISVAPIYILQKLKEHKDVFSSVEPKIVFCQTERAKDVQLALDDLNLDSKVVTFDKGCENGKNISHFGDLLQEYGSGSDVNDFKPSDFDPEDTIAALISTSGTTGVPKQAPLTHKNYVISGPLLWSRCGTFPSPIKMSLVTSPLRGNTTLINFNMAPVLRYTMLMTPIEMNQEHFYNLVNGYKPDFMFLTPTKLASLLPGIKDKCDLSCFDTILTGGIAVSVNLLDNVKKLYPKTEVYDAHGISEASGLVFMFGDCARGSCGKPVSHLLYRIIDMETQEDIMEPHKAGELWIKGPSVFKGYYKNDVATKEALTEDGWFKTGDKFYRDEHYNFFFVERIKLLLKYNTQQVSPTEIEHLIKQLPGVQDVAVTGIPDDECGDLPAACVVRRTGHHVTAQEIKDLVKETLTDYKQLRGGVVFLNELPLTSTQKVDYQKIKKMFVNMERE